LSAVLLDWAVQLSPGHLSISHVSMWSRSENSGNSLEYEFVTECRIGDGISCSEDEGAWSSYPEWRDGDVPD
jgi:hypothetical protein